MSLHGNQGEKLVSYLSSKSDILATPPEQDQFGWDLHLQFSSNIAPIFLDEHESSYSAYVQVKEFSKDYSSYTGRDIKLSNIQHMISSSMPFFVVYAQIKTEELYVVHMDYELIEQGLKKIRQAQATNTLLHKSTMKINPHKYQTIKVLSSDNLRNVLIELIGSSPKKYSEEKARFFQSVGYEKGAMELIGCVSNKELLEVELGLKNRAEIKVEQFNSIRFETSLPFPEKPTKVTLLSNECAESIGVNNNVVPNNDELYLRRPNETLPLILSGKLRISSQSSKFGVFAFDSDFFKLVIEVIPPFSMQAIFNFPKLLATKMTIEELRHQLEISTYLFSGDELMYGFKSLDSGECTRATEKNAGIEIKEVHELLASIDSYEQLKHLVRLRNTSLMEPNFLFCNRHKLNTIAEVILNNNPSTFKFETVTGIKPGESTLVFVPIQINMFGNDYILTVRLHGAMRVFDGKGFLSEGYSHSLLSPILADKKSVRDLFKKIDNLIDVDRESVHRLIIYESMDKKLAVAARPSLKNNI